MTDEAQTSTEPVDGDEFVSPVPASPEVVPASGALPAPGAANVIGTYQAPNPGAQPGEVSEQPLVAGTAADPNPAPDKAPKDLITGTADDPKPEDSAAGGTDPAAQSQARPPAAPDELEDGELDEFEPAPALVSRGATRHARDGVQAGPANHPRTQHTKLHA